MTKTYLISGEHWISKPEIAENVEITNSEIIFKHSDGSSTHYIKDKVYNVIETKEIYDKDYNYSFEKIISEPYRK